MNHVKKLKWKMAKTIRHFKGVSYSDKDTPNKFKDDRKRFCFRDESWATKAKGGPGYKGGWKQPFGKKRMLKYKKDYLPDDE